MQKSFKRFQWLSIFVLVLVMVLTLRLPAIAQTPRQYNEITFPPLPEIKIPKYDRYQLKNGMIVYLMEDHQLPLISGNALIRTGSRLEPSKKVGLAELAGTMLRIGGTQYHSPSQVNELLDQNAAIVETLIGTSSGSASFNALKEDIEPVFGLFAEILRYPVFDDKQLTIAKTQQKGEISRRNDDPGDIASREFQKLIYGESSPYARTIEFTTLNNISRDNIVDFYQTYVRPDEIILGVVGDFEPQQMKALIEKTFADWKPPATPPKIDIPTASQKYDRGVFFVNQPQLTQSNILIGHLGGKLSNPDYPALSVMNEVLNGFGGRLFNQLRSRQGLAYSVYGYWSANYDFPGMFLAGGQTRSETTVTFVQSLLKELERIQTEPITEQELALAKDSILNSFVFKFANSGQILSRLMNYEYYGYPADFIFNYQRGVQATTISDIQRVAQKYLKPDQIVTLVVGNKQTIQPPLSQLGGEVKVVDVTIPQPKS
ncbi:pitrilysin family protein [Chroococcus sp. FPU101]|uniref:M16 family metallopeptidase n=1 Tax=Chroococcus sp. FPU101 TaxID=1974212 RepID=UPI001A8EBF48|nr:pitrilysin family protein [Chroococcus sp. FPU101]GFE70492.1 peptidase M16 domain protein [Chroococcus sp. FPU101]